MENGLIAADGAKILTVKRYGFRCKNFFTTFLGYIAFCIVMDLLTANQYPILDVFY
jgi:hypothetical protein